LEDSLLKRYKSKFTTNSVSLLISSALTILIPRYLGPARYGDFNFLNVFFTRFFGFLALGTPIAFFTKLSKRPKELRLIRFYVFFLFAVLLFSILFLTVIYSTNNEAILFININENYILLAFVYCFLLFLSEIVRQVNDAFAFTYFSERIFLIIRLLVLILVGLFIYFEIINLFFYYYILITCFSVLLICWTLYLYRKGVRPFGIENKLDNTTKRRYISEFYAYSSPLFIAGLFTLFTVFGERWLLQFYGGSVQQGYYSFSYAVASIIFLFTGSMSPLFTREFSIAWKNNDFIRMRSLYNKLIPLLIILATYLSFFVAFNSEYIIQLIAGTSYSDASLIISVMAIYPIHQTYGQLCASILYASGNTRLIRNVSIPIDIIGLLIVLILLFPKDLGGFEMSSLGLAYKMVFMQFIAVNIYLYHCTKLLKLSYINSLKFQLIIITVFSLCAFITKELSTYYIVSDLLQLFINFIVFSIAIVLFFIVFPKLLPINKNDIKYFINSLKF
jgi:O-antigen/teichoic acid export membrane protein